MDDDYDDDDVDDVRVKAPLESSEAREFPARRVSLVIINKINKKKINVKFRERKSLWKVGRK